MEKEVRINGKAIRFTHVDKVLFPKGRITKGELLDYYVKIIRYMMPYLQDRVVARKRFPQGIGKPGFYHKEIPSYFPNWISRFRVKKESGWINEVVIKKPRDMIFLVQEDCITPHALLSRIDRINKPDKIVFDLDPSGSFYKARGVALALRVILQRIGLKSFIMTTGSNGLHVVVPIKRDLNFNEIRNFAGRVAKLAAKSNKDATLEIRKNKRKGRVFVDVLRNSYAQMSVPPYAVRAREGAPVATPIYWEEVKKIKPQDYNIKNVFSRLKKKGNPWKDFFRSAGDVRRARERLGKMRD